MDKSGTSTKLQTRRAWVDGGVLYIEFQKEITLPAILEIQKKSMDLLNEGQIKVLPIIVILKNISRDQYKLRMADYGKIVGAFNFVEHISSLWVVGPDEEVKRFVGVANKLYFSNKLRVVDTLKEAQDAAQHFVSSTESILEKE
jgi:hypothetical protein